MRVLTACKRWVSQLARYLDAARQDSVYVPHHDTAHAPMLVCPSCGAIFTPLPSDEISQGEARLLWGDQ
jgi:hypothetical protein